MDPSSIYFLTHNKKLQRNMGFSAWSDLSSLATNFLSLSLHNDQNTQGDNSLNFFRFSHKSSMSP